MSESSEISRKIPTQFIPFSVRLVVSRVAKIVTIYSSMHCKQAWIQESKVVQDEDRNSNNNGSLTDRPQQISAEDKQTVMFK